MSLRDLDRVGTIDGQRVPVTLARSLDLDRARGALLGLAVGDALGTTFARSRPTVAPLPTLVTGDAPQMATCLVATLMASGLVDVDDLARRYVAWMHHAFDIGAQTRAALSAVAGGRAPTEAGRDVWLASGRRSAGNGSLARTAPIGLFSAHSPDNRRIASMVDSAITHFDPRCQIACAAFNTAVARAVKDRAAPAEMAAAARAEVGESHAYLVATLPDERVAIDAAATDLLRDLDAAGAADPALGGPEVHLLEQSGFVRVAFRLAFWHLLHATSFEAALVDVVNRGGDAEAHGAITGALLGVRFGEAAIPLRWRQVALEAVASEPGPLATLYHPRRLLDLVPADD